MKWHAGLRAKDKPLLSLSGTDACRQSRRQIKTGTGGDTSNPQYLRETGSIQARGEVCFVDEIIVILCNYFQTDGRRKSSRDRRCGAQKRKDGQKTVEKFFLDVRMRCRNAGR